MWGYEPLNSFLTCFCSVPRVFELCCTGKTYRCLYISFCVVVSHCKTSLGGIVTCAVPTVEVPGRGLLTLGVLVLLSAAAGSVGNVHSGLPPMNEWPR